MTRWAPIPSYEAMYEISEHGEVRSLARVINGQPIRSRILATSINSRGYRRVGLSRNGSKKTFEIHVLVMRAFVGVAPAGMEVCHVDGDSLNNDLGNLRYGTRSDNALDRVRHGSDANAKRTHCNHGHEFTPANTSRDANGARRCRACKRAQQITYRARKAVAS